MSTHVALYHRTTYTYDEPITIHPHIVRLRPSPHCRTPILSYSLTTKPENHFINWQQDPFGNYLARFVFPEKTDKLEFVVDLVADLTTINPFDFFLEDDAKEVPFQYDETELTELAPYLKQTGFAAGLDELAAELKPTEPMVTIDFLVAVNQAVQQMIHYNVRLDVGVQTCEETLEKRSGSCRDSSYLLVQLFRQLGLAARFVSGYSVQLVPDEKPLEGPAGVTQDVTDLHAWAEVFLPGAGWVGLDPTSGLFAGEGHIPLACTPEPSSAAPVLGSTEPAEALFDFANVVTRVHEDPRVTKPYSEEEWKAVNAVGKLVDKKLVDGDVRLTMGGEPTFVSIDDMEGDEWNTTADSPFKRERAIELTNRLQEAFAPGGFIWFGEGKWYPGEPVPRWAYGVFWRKDGYPMWRSHGTQGDPAKPGDYGFEEPRLLAEAIVDELGVEKDCVIPALEDIDYYRWKISTLPHSEHDPEDDDSLERRTIKQLEERGLDVPTGYVVPMFHKKTTERWTGSTWKMKRESLYLIPGSSAMGFRLPLDSIRKATEEDVIEERSPIEDEFPPLDPNPLKNYSEQGDDDSGEDTWIPRTALSIENREGRLHVFFPPTGKLEAYLELLAAVEKAAETTNLKVIIEGYEPPKDPRIESLKVTPDPGVIEVNIHPSSSWDELVELTETLYEEARQSRLGAEKFMLDGRHTGTGGGNHVVIGGATPAESPFVRRPEVLASMIAYWQHHPGLSYLFSGLFIGPTSQAPRVDETRDDRLFELDIALETLHEGVDEPIMIDRTLRNLLTDLTGNTHRAEICIDKMCSPDSKTGQLGLLELRGFEMPPHRHMSLVQSLLVRSIIARCWENPYRYPLVRWGTTLHDKFLLPHWVWDDITEVCDDLNRAGIPFQRDWLLPFFEFRFPRVGTVTNFGVELEVRTALEPWHVLGEESTSQGTSRFVDSSVERLQVKVRGLVEGKHILTCNGRHIPLMKSGTREEWVGGVRFKAWDPISALHPSIKAQTKLVFDLIDTRNRKSLGGCVYHVGHPGGRNYETFPVNAREAESRRLTRFWEYGHTAGDVTTAAPIQVPGVSPGKFETIPGGQTVEFIPRERCHGDCPNTLDLRAPTEF